MAENSNANDNDANSSHYPLHRERSELSITSPSILSLGDVSKRINKLQLELAARTRELGDVKAKYDRVLVDMSDAARETAQLRA